jgi:hypothetical protein
LRGRARLTAAAGGEAPGLEGTRGMVGRMFPGALSLHPSLSSVRCSEGEMQ